MDQRVFRCYCYLTHVLVVWLIVMNFVVPHDISEIIKIQAPRIVPERADLTLECELQVHDDQELSINWYFSEIKTPVQSISNMQAAQASGKSTLLIKSVLKQQSNLYYCCLESATTVPNGCVSHSLLVLYTTLEQRIMEIDESTAVLVLTRSADATPAAEDSTLSFAICLRYRWKLEQVQLFAFPDTLIQDSHPNGSLDVEKGTEKPLCKYMNYNVEATSPTDNRLFLIKSIDLRRMSTVTYHLHVFLNGKPKPKMNGMTVLPDEGSFEIFCWGTAFPAPRVKFFFTPCPSLEWHNCNNPPVQLDEVISTSSTITFNESLPVSFGSHITAGIVQCQASNADGTAIAHSKIFKHHQRMVMSLQILHPTDTIYQGDSIIVQCSADRHIFTNSFTFRTEDEQRSIALHDVPDAEHSFNWVANFTISNVTITGDYGVECEAMHHNGTLSSRRLSLKIVRPYLTVRERLIRVVARGDPEPLLLSCNAAGRPMPQYRWYRNGELLPNTNFMLVVTSSVKDEYACYTWNRAGEEWIRWDIVHREEADEHVLYQSIVAGVLFIIAVFGCIMCYIKIRQLYTLLRIYRAAKNRQSSLYANNLCQELHTHE
ncbi:uncharacterized protein LOC120902099 [Anopheles arabiensis]|uniref:uncharacterized protein LOC120902099 n=1 Tax=Anopheles arabiensis TaxID=7173 RepID=UPI001AAD9227|nr:uncharacterized protein LOC120902099 [Anopheles arabiensis]